MMNLLVYIGKNFQNNIKNLTSGNPFSSYATKM